MRIVDIIRKKRDGEGLSDEEIAFLVEKVVRGDLDPAQIGAFLMACYFRGLSKEETSHLAIQMAHSGEMLDLSEIPGTVDKHSTGGVGDKTTLVVAPLAAAAGVPVLKLSGPALGHTGGTIDRLKAIPGFRTDLEIGEFISQVKDIRVAVGGHTKDLVPADKILYAARDRTATVEVIPLIASSVMSKKLAGGAEAIVLDVKCGGGAFMPELNQAKELAEAMVAIGEAAGRRTCALITDMEQPLGNAVGEGLETWEAIETLKGNGPKDFVELCLLVASHMIYLGKKADSVEQARTKAEELLESGAALNKFRQMVEAQGGDPEVVENPGPLAESMHSRDIRAARDGYITAIDARRVGEIARSLVQSHRGGVILERKVGDMAKEGEVLARMLSDSKEALDSGAERMEGVFTLGDNPPAKRHLLLHPPIGGS